MFTFFIEYIFIGLLHLSFFFELFMMSSDNVQEANKSIAPPRSGSIVSGKTVLQMLFFTFLMITLPISSYFISKSWVYEGYLQISSENSVIPSALTAVVMVHIVLGLFVYAAYTEEIPLKKKQA